MQYLTYEEYTLKGGTLDLTAFNRHIDRVCGIVKNATQSRLESLGAIPSEAKALCRDLVEYFDRNNTSDTVVSSRSQSAGAVSESESYVTKTTAEADADVDKMIFDYLASVKDDCGTPVLYRGCMH